MNLKKTHIAFLFCFGVLMIFSATDAHAQRKDFKYKFISKLISADSTESVITRAHVINTTQKLGTVSDEYGTFTITANVGDSIMFSAIGYETLRIAASDSMYTNNRIVRLIPTTYELSEVNIGILSTYDRFKQGVLGQESQTNNFGIDPISKFEVYTPPLPNQGGLNIPFVISPVTFLYNLLSKEGRQQRYLLSVVNGTADHVVIGEKFNGLIVNQLTGLKDDELVKFMSYCNFPKEYLLQASEAEINRAVMQMYREYVKGDR